MMKFLIPTPLFWIIKIFFVAFCRNEKMEPQRNPTK